MSGVWQRMKKWCTVQPQPQESKTSGTPLEDRMVGEPVRSFLKSFNDTPKRYKLTVAIRPKDAYSWMTVRGFYQLHDRKTGDVYNVYIHEEELYSVSDLPFKLNHWEMRAISAAFHHRYEASLQRRSRMWIARKTREREAAVVAEQKARLQFAKRFQ